MRTLVLWAVVVVLFALTAFLVIWPLVARIDADARFQSYALATVMVVIGAVLAAMGYVDSPSASSLDIGPGGEDADDENLHARIDSLLAHIDRLHARLDDIDRRPRLFE